MATPEQKDEQILVPQRPLTLKERIEEHKMAGYGAMIGAVAGAAALGPLGAAIGGGLGGGVGSLIDHKFRRKNTPENDSEQPEK